MHCLENMSRIQIPAEQILDLIKLYKFNGKEFYYKNVFKPDLNQISKEVIEKETFYLAKIANVNLTEARLKILTKNNAVPKNKDEQFVLNMKRVFEKIHKNIDHVELIVPECQRLANNLYDKIVKVDFIKTTYTDRSSLIPTRVVKSSRESLDGLLNLFNKMRKTDEYETTLMIVNFYVDFMNMKIFDKNNDMIGLLLLYMFLFYLDFRQFMLASFFEKIYKKYNFFTNACVQASFNWEDGYSQTAPLHKMIVSILHENYKEIEAKLRDYEFDNNLNKSDDIENTILHMSEIFSKDDIRSKHPYVSESTIDRTLKRLKDNGQIRPLGTGRSARWQRIYEIEPRFNREQLSMFSDD